MGTVLYSNLLETCTLRLLILVGIYFREQKISYFVLIFVNGYEQKILRVLILRIPKK